MKNAGLSLVCERSGCISRRGGAAGAGAVTIAADIKCKFKAKVEGTHER
jgi:hypothetical protein